MTSPTSPGYGVPDPDANRAAWLAEHGQSDPVSPGEAQEQVAAQIGAGAPAQPVSGEQLGQQLAAAGATAGLPHEATMDALMEQIRALSDQVQTLSDRDRQREAATIAALGEPILQRYANAIADYFRAHAAASPGLGNDHFGPVTAAADKMAAAAADAIARGGNDLGTVRYYAGQVDRFLTRGHRVKAPPHLAHVDLSAVEQALEYVIDEADRLSGSSAALAVP